MKILFKIGDSSLGNKKRKKVSIKNEKTIYYFNALLIAIFIASLVLSIENMNNNRNKWCYTTGCIGRDLTYTLVSLFFLTYIQYTNLLNTNAVEINEEKSK